MSLSFYSSRWSWATLSLRVPSTLKLVSLDAWSGTGALRSVPSTDVSQALAHLLGVLSTGLVISPTLSSGKSLSALYSNIYSEVLLCWTLAYKFTKNKIFNTKQQPPDCRPGFKQFRLTSTSVLEHLWEDVSYVGEVMLCEGLVQAQITDKQRTGILLLHRCPQTHWWTTKDTHEPNNYTLHMHLPPKPVFWGIVVRKTFRRV